MKRSLRALRAGLALAIGLGGLAGPGCATAIPYGAVGFKVESNLADATVWVDDVLVGRTVDWSREGRHIHSGFHRVEIRHAGYYSVFQEVELPEGAHTTVKAQLRPMVE